jgi:hypothetical protein
MRLAFRELPERRRQTTGTKLREAHTALMAIAAVNFSA